MIKHEAKFQTRFNKWLKYEYPKTLQSGAFELKVVTVKNFYFKQIRAHQLIALNMAKNMKLPYKIADVGMAQKPFDCILLQNCNAYLVIKWIDEPKMFYMIDIATVEELIAMNKVGLSKDECAQFGEVYHLK